MIDIRKDKLLTLTEASRLFPGRRGGQIKYGTIRRWVSVGVKGVRLETVPVGGGIRTTEQACREFTRRLQKIRESKYGEATSDASADVPCESSESAHEQLAAAGFFG